MTDTTPEVGPIVKVSRDLSAIIDMTPQLDEQAEAKANATMDGSNLPGGLAMVALAPVANIEAWEHQYEAAERAGKDTSWVEDEDDSWEPPLQTLRFWSDAWRAEHDADYGQRPTVLSEAKFIKASLTWAWDHEPAFDDFAKDIRAARVRMENVLFAGVRVERTRIECDQCEPDKKKPKRLVKVYADAIDGSEDWWKCPSCKHRFDVDALRKAHARMLRRDGAAKFVHQADAIATLKAQGRPERTIRKWLSEGEGEAYCDPTTHEVWIWWPDLWRKHLTTETRNRASASNE